jgi:polar amino acid transport system substrate-binding protein
MSSLMLNLKRCVLAALTSLALGIPFAHPVYATETLVFSALEGSGPQEVAKSVLAEAYRHIGIPIQFVALPGERALAESNSGRNDGEVARLTGLQKKYNNLIRVPISVSQLDGVAFTRNLDIHTDGWHRLKNLRIGAFIGSKFVERNAASLNVLYVPAVSNLFRMLERDRLDVIVIPYLTGLNYIKENSLAGIRALTPSLTTIKLYHYVHKNHIDLLPRINASLEAMLEQGRIEHHRQAFISNLLISN